MKNQSQARADTIKGAAAGQPKLTAGRQAGAQKRCRGGITFVCQYPDGREWARVHFEPPLAARLEAASVRLGLSPAEFMRQAIENRLAPERRAA
jgi:hypothetical protein